MVQPLGRKLAVRVRNKEEEKYTTGKARHSAGLFLCLFGDIKYTMAINSPNLNLRIWNAADDLFNHTELATNWTYVDQHDHTSGKGLQIPAGGLAANSVTTAKITDANVTKAKLSTDSLQAFLQLLVAGDHKVAWGTTTMTMDNSGDSTNNWPSLGSVTVTHGLSATPVVVLAIGSQIDSSARPGQPKAPALATGTINSTTFQLFGQVPGISSSTTTIRWLAIT